MAEPLKHQFADDVVHDLARRFAAQRSEFPSDDFVETCLDAFASLELKDRINLVADTLARLLRGPYPAALADVCEVADGVEGFAAWPLCSYVERHGVDHPVESLGAMATLTTRFSCEFAIRPYLDHHVAATFVHLERWAVDDDEHVRRLVSEGTRPALPWGPKVQALLDDPTLGLGLLERLRSDPTEMVRRSVANHLNDVSKQHPDLVVATVSRWVHDVADLDMAMVRHALRTLVKRGHAGALAVLGYTTEPVIEIPEFTCSPTAIRLGEQIELRATLVSSSARHQRLVVDFVIHHVKASGATSPKVFKWTTLDLAAGDTVEIVKRRRIATASTRRYHQGPHVVELQVSGSVIASSQFDLLDSS